ncbi:hypothetical protein E1295_02160 [Nonomuraea mesophila]|uniref:Uncharacterized protein n=1 Tax=Nonomuraea mesophila TaxID=2530382 RepID=A0A4R5FXH1_9ACTN|nr:hypothetical protein [Nonomuraea mesophila]TDE59715.1 hypothetical protein E1295_02160 [Nonomuraea mesophila]
MRCPDLAAAARSPSTTTTTATPATPTTAAGATPDARTSPATRELEFYVTGDVRLISLTYTLNGRATTLRDDPGKPPGHPVAAALSLSRGPRQVAGSGGRFRIRDRQRLQCFPTQQRREQRSRALLRVFDRGLYHWIRHHTFSREPERAWRRRITGVLHRAACVRQVQSNAAAGEIEARAAGDTYRGILVGITLIERDNAGEGGEA